MKRRCAKVVHGKMVRRRSAGDQQGDSLVLHQTYGVEETFSVFFLKPQKQVGQLLCYRVKVCVSVVLLD